METKSYQEQEMIYRKYANKFWSEITTTLWSDNGAFEFLPIVFTDRKLYNEKGNTVFGVTYIHTNTATNVGVIYPVVSISDIRTKEEIERTIRHEVIHYLLGVKYQCHDDSSALFWLICDCFGGKAYLPMNEKSQRIYEFAKPHIDWICEKHKLTKNKSAAINFSLMLTVIDSIEANSSPDYDKLESSLIVCVKAAKHACS